MVPAPVLAGEALLLVDMDEVMITARENDVIDETFSSLSHLRYPHN